VICLEGCWGPRLGLTGEGSQRGRGDSGGVVGLRRHMDDYRERKRNIGAEGGDGLSVG